MPQYYIEDVLGPYKLKIISGSCFTNVIFKVLDHHHHFLSFPTNPHNKRFLPMIIYTRLIKQSIHTNDTTIVDVAINIIKNSANNYIIINT